jgi:hypothetical protein
MVAATPRTLLDRVLDPLAECFTPEVARRIVAISLDPAIQSQLDRLAEKANEGQLTEAERGEYAELIEALDILGILKAKARVSLIERRG